MDKTVLRQEFINRRKALSTTEISDKSKLICHRLQSQSFFQEAQTILSYFAFRNEPHLEALFSLNKTWGLPRCVNQQLIWHHYQFGDRRVVGKFDIWEPNPDLPLLDVRQIDVIFVPALACSQRGDRLGYGAGFYDRFLATLEHQVITVGIIFECCFVPELPRDPWDIPLDFVCTEKQLYRI